MVDKNFDEKYASKLRAILISSDMSMVNKAKEIFDELKVEVVDHAPTVKMARERMILNADKLLPYNFILITNTNSQFSEEGIHQSKDILVKVRCDKLYLNTPIIIVEDEATGTDPKTIEENSQVKFMKSGKFDSLGTEFVNFIAHSYPEGPQSLKTAFKKGIYYIYIPNEMDTALFNEMRDLNNAIKNNNVMIQILDFKKSRDRLNDKEIQVLMDYCKESEKNKLPVSSLNIPNELMFILQNKGIDRTFNPRKDLQEALKTINIDVKKKPKAQPSSRGGGGGGGGGAGMKMNVNVINPFLAACSELFKETEGKNVIVERPRLCIKFDDPGVQFASLIRFFDPKFKGGVLFAYSDKSINKLKQDNPSSMPTRELSLHIEKIIDSAKLKSNADDSISPSSIEILKSRDEIATAVGKKGAIRIRFVSEANWLDAYIIK